MGACALGYHVAGGAPIRTTGGIFNTVLDRERLCDLSEDGILNVCFRALRERVPGALSRFASSAHRVCVVRCFCLIGLLMGELVALSVSDQAPEIAISGWSFAAVHYRRALLAGVIAAGTTFVLLTWSIISDELHRSPDGRALRNPGWRIWLAVHLLSMCLVLECTALAVRGGLIFPRIVLWGLVWLATGGVALLSWSAAALPPSLWLRCIRRCPGAIAGGTLVGIVARIAGSYVELSWSTFERPTVLLVCGLLRTAGQEVVCRPGGWIETPGFIAYVGAECSGLEGMALISAFLLAYLWSYRAELRFPQVLLLFPLGVAAAWVLNVVRIAALVEVGNFGPDLAIQGFHSLAGWFSVCVLACVMVSATYRLDLFCKARVTANFPACHTRAAAYVVPFLTITAISTVSKAFSRGDFDTLYPIRVVLPAAAILLYRKQFSDLTWKISWWGPLVGALTFIVWILFEPGADGGSDRAFAVGFGALPPFLRAWWLFFRLAGAVITVPIAEELVFRGYLTRKLISPDFELVRVGHFTWLSFLGSSLLFGLLHHQWLPGILAGMLFAIASYRRGLLCDAVIAHATCNALLSALVLTTQKWSLWG